jgi:WD40 repeat protein
MTVEYSPGSELEQRFNDVLADYFAALDADRRVDRQHLLSLHPELADDLSAFFAEQDEMAQVAAPLRQVVHSELVETESGEETPGPNTGLDRNVQHLHSIGDYENLVEIGRGGMGVVYRARQRSLNRLVAVKMVHAGALASVSAIEQLKHEAEAAARLDHPHIVSVYDVGECAGQPFFSMQLIEGGSVADKAQRPTAEPRLCATLLERAARAIHYAHQRGILHRDLKPSNILLDQEGQPHITDFGLAKRIDAEGSLTHSGVLIGTPNFMAPEQAAGQRDAVTTATDVYGLGAVLYSLLAGRPPFRGDSLFGTLEQIQHQETVPPSRFNPLICRDLETICLKCLRKEPRERYQSAAELAEDLDRYQKGELIQARPATSLERLAKWARRQPARAALAGVSALAALASIAFALGSFHNVQLRKERDEVDRQKIWAEHHQSIAEQRRELANRYLYNAQLNLAHRQWQEGCILNVLEILQEHRPKYPIDQDLRSFEWYYLWRLCHAERLVVPAGHAIFALSPDGRQLAVSLRDWTIWIMDLATGQKSVRFPPPHGIPLCMAFSENGRRLCTVAHDRTVRIFDVVTGQRLASHDGLVKQAVSMVFRSDGKLLATGDLSGVATIWDPDAGKKITSLSGHARPISSLGFSADGRRLVTSSLDRSVRVWDLATGQTIHVLDAKAGEVSKAIFSADGSYLATAGRDGVVRLWDAARFQELVACKGHAGPVLTVDFSADSKWLVSGGVDQTIRRWDATTGRELAVLKGHTGDVNRLAFSPDGRVIVSGSLDCSVRIWDTFTEPESITLEGPDGKLPDCASDPVGAFTAEQRLGPIFRAWSEVAHHEMRQLQGGATGDCITSSSDGRYVAWGSPDGTIRLYAADNGRAVRTLRGHSAKVTVVTLSADGSKLASGGADGSMRIWNVASGRQIDFAGGDSPNPPVASLAFSQDGNQLAAVSGGTLRLWRSLDAPIPIVFTGVAGSVQGMAFSADGERIASAHDDKIVRIWNVATKVCWRLLKGHTGQVRSVAFSPDGKRLASASWDKTVRLWDLTTGQEILSFRGLERFSRCLAFSPDGKQLAAGSLDDTVRIWNASKSWEEPGALRSD